MQQTFDDDSVSLFDYTSLNNIFVYINLAAAVCWSLDWTKSEMQATRSRSLGSSVNHLTNCRPSRRYTFDKLML